MMFRKAAIVAFAGLVLTPAVGASAAFACGAWKVQSAPNATSIDFLDGVKSISAKNAWAVGGSFNGASDKTMTEHWNGKSWKLVTSPNRGTGNNVLYAVAASSSTNVWAVGFSVGAPNARTLIEHRSTGSWKIVRSPNGSGGDVLYGVTTVSSKSAWAVGSSNVTGTDRVLVERYKAGAWHIVAAPNVGTFANNLFGVTAISATDVWAVGNYYTGSTNQTLIEHWNGAKWSVFTVANPDASDQLRSASRSSASNIWAVGDGAGALTEAWDASLGTWAAETSPDPGTNDVLFGVATVSPSNAWAVGHYYNGSNYQTLVEHWSGTAWTVAASPDVGTANNTLSAVSSTPGSSRIWAVGSAGDATLIERSC